MSPVERVRSRFTPTADHVHGSPVCGSQQSVDPLTVGHTVRVSHRLQITVYDHSPDPTADHHSQWSFCWWSRDCGSQRSADPLTAGHTVRVSHRLWITVDDHSPDPDVDDHSRWFSLYLYLLDFITMLNYMTSPMPSTRILVCFFIITFIPFPMTLLVP